ncbi:gamma-glutamylcyclotransferase family protein [Aquibacillus rhizosphaerae]|uniref:Gamma-glutamylcyclotransferase family protein n=1 Tax=Aquibacillus rhizosphaerae TaxID=3051431 RepID=A0ABT7L8K1_9BACI|nr:gamma-glutamylcyclotransferase family protein [Aquibacillus sp. LR5S19]MDL4842198.1 gamma-glutamylcyclotransferase family protein [Aquibacillus sp. LR5S19]
MPLYFAYGSCMSLIDLKRHVPEAIYVESAILKDYRLGFTLWSKHRQGGVADIVSEIGSEVEGKIFDVPNFKGLDLREGHPHMYRRISVEVYPFNQSKPIVLSTYEVVNKKKEMDPSKSYADIIMDGCVHLTDGYQKALKTRFKGIID